MRWWARVATDAVCVRTTRLPEALVQALRQLARASGEQVPVGLWTRLLGMGGSQWAVELGRVDIDRTVNNRMVDHRTGRSSRTLGCSCGPPWYVGSSSSRSRLRSRRYQDIAARAPRRAGRRRGRRRRDRGRARRLDGVVMADGVAPAGWHPDPLGRARLRWWDGASWTDRTST